MKAFKALLPIMALTLGSAAHAVAKDADCGTNKPILVHIANDGSIRWQSTPVTYTEAIRRFSDAAKRNPMPNIQIDPDRMARYDDVARVLVNIQRTGFHCIGFTGTMNGR